VPALAAAASSTGTVTVTVPASTVLGPYRVLACADDLHAVAEVDEGNNCLATAGVVVVGRPDLIVSAVTAAPATALPGGTLTVTETVENQGPAPAAASKTRYYLSLDRAKGSGDTLLTGARLVPGLAPGALSTATTGIVIPAGAPAGTFYLLACADDFKAVVETDEGNNCRPTDSPLTLGGPDLVVSAVSDPPSSIGRGEKFPVTSTTVNQGAAPAGRTTRTRFYLSADTVKDGADKLLTGSRPVADLAAGAESTGVVTIAVPTTTAFGQYYLLACADGTEAVVETSETNNCRASATLVVVGP